MPKKKVLFGVVEDNKTEKAPEVVREPFEPTREWDFKVYKEGAEVVMKTRQENVDQYIARTLTLIENELKLALK